MGQAVNMMTNMINKIINFMKLSLCLGKGGGWEWRKTLNK